MSSYHPKEAPTSKTLPCPECGKAAMRTVVKDCVLDDGAKIPKLRHYKCRACGALFFDDEAMHVIQSQRSSHALAA